MPSQLQTLADVAPTQSAGEAADIWGDLMEAALAGNGGAYRRLLTEIQPWLSRYFARRLPMGMAEDAVQDTLIAIHSKRHTYEPGRPFRAWLGAIARYKWIDRLRAMSRQPTSSLEDELDEPSVGGHEASVTSAIVLKDLMDRLKPAQRNVIHLVKVEGYSIQEAAERTGQSESLVKVNIHRGLAKLAAIVQSADY